MLQLEELTNPIAGFSGKPSTLRARGDEPRIVVRTINMGSVKKLCPTTGIDGHITGAGAGTCGALASVPAVVEAVERYCASVCSDDQFIFCSANELGGDCIDLDSLPQCSERELSHPGCPLVKPDKAAPMRWVKALCLHSGKVKYVPAVLVYIYAGFVSDAERIAYPITTGCAAHMSVEKALLNGILEVVERDAISILWLQQLCLPTIEFDEIAPALLPYWELYQRSSKELECLFFDATTDIGLPIVYGVQISRNSQHARTLVACSAALNPSEAVAKVFRDMAAGRIAFRKVREAPKEFDQFKDVWHGATYMANAERAAAFAFLVNTGFTQPISGISRVAASGERDALCKVLANLQRNGLEAYAVELTTDEALRAGLRIVKVLIPGLQPLGFQYRARYLGHRRLYDAPLRMGYKSQDEEHLNPWPQPFA